MGEIPIKFTTGAQRSPTTAGGSLPTDYSQFSHIAARLHAETQAEGNEKYGYGNWQMGIPMSNLLSHCLAHIFAYMNGDRSENHLGHAIWNLDKAAHFSEVKPELNDLTVPIHASTLTGAPASAAITNAIDGAFVCGICAQEIHQGDQAITSTASPRRRARITCFQNAYRIDQDKFLYDK